MAKANGLQADGDFAFFFDAYGDAEAEVGPEVATAWQACRRRVQQGLGASVKDLMAKESVVLAPAQPKGGSSAKSPAPLPSAVIPRFKPTLEPPVSPKEPFLAMLKHAARQATSLKPGQGETLDDVVEAMLPKLQRYWR